MVSMSVNYKGCHHTS